MTREENNLGETTECRAPGHNFVCGRTGRFATLVHRDLSGEVDLAFLRSAFRDLKSGKRRNWKSRVRVGRGFVLPLVLPSGEEVFARRFLRGGFVAKVNQDVFFHNEFGNLGYRPFRELAILERLQESGISVPTPVAGLVELRAWGLTYRGMLVTKSVGPNDNLLILGLSVGKSRERREAFQEACRRAGHEARKALEAGVYHVDLHLGNVLVGPEGEVFLIDFDRAEEMDIVCARDSGIEHTAERWERSARKHGLLHEALEPFEEGLRKMPEEKN